MSFHIVSIVSIATISTISFYVQVQLLGKCTTEVCNSFRFSFIFDQHFNFTLRYLLCVPILLRYFEEKYNFVSRYFWNIPLQTVTPAVGSSPAALVVPAREHAVQVALALTYWSAAQPNFFEHRKQHRRSIEKETKHIICTLDFLICHRTNPSRISAWWFFIQVHNLTHFKRLSFSILIS